MARFRTLTPGQVARIHVHDAGTGEDIVVHENPDVLLEAPNWSVSGDSLLLNGAGVLWSLPPVPNAQPRPITHAALPEINNDHVLDPDGDHIYLSATDGHIYRASLAGGAVSRVTAEEGVWHFLHGVSPDGARLAYVHMTSLHQPGRLATIPSTGGQTTFIDTGDGHIDGPEYSPDGAWLYFNTERWANKPGQAQLARIPTTGGNVERLVTSNTVDWFPHLSPDGARAVYLEYPPGTQGHPANNNITLVVVNTTDWTTHHQRIHHCGGQGTINVNSWAPNSQHFAYITYPTDN